MRISCLQPGGVAIAGWTAVVGAFSFGGDFRLTGQLPGGIAEGGAEDSEREGGGGIS
jgi:hypothetical protein